MSSKALSACRCGSSTSSRYIDYPTATTCGDEKYEE
jgi:hypothetical protein